MVQNLTDKNSYYANTYLFEADGHAMLVDASVPAETLANALKCRNLTLDSIVLTHGHYDHLIFIDELRKEFPEATVIAHEDERQVLSDPEGNVSTLFGDTKTYDGADKYVKDGDKITIGNTEFTVVSTPGHTPGSICLYCEKDGIMFTGDTLFSGGIGRTDFKYGSYDDIMKSLSRLAGFDEKTRFYPGHGEDGILGWEF